MTEPPVILIVEDEVAIRELVAFVCHSTPDPPKEETRLPVDI